jgi:hypothetical protein
VIASVASIRADSPGGRRLLICDGIVRQPLILPDRRDPSVATKRSRAAPGTRTNAIVERAGGDARLSANREAS